MSTANSTAGVTTQQLIDQRLDAIDRALLGLVPRGERLAMVAQVESRIRDLAAEEPVNETCVAQRAISLGLSDAGEVDGASALDQAPIASRSTRIARRKLSRLALAAGVLGIIAAALFFLTPIIYFIVAMVGEMTDEMIAIGLLGAHTVTIAVGGLAAVALGIAALVQLRRRSRNLAGYGWAVTGLCTGPMPALVGGLVILVVGLQLLGSSVVRVQTISSPTSGAVRSVPAAAPATMCEKVAEVENTYPDVARVRNDAPLEDKNPPLYGAGEPPPPPIRRSPRPQLYDEEPAALPAPLPPISKQPAAEPQPPQERPAEESSAR